MTGLHVVTPEPEPDPWDIGQAAPENPVIASERALLGTVIQSATAAHEAAAILQPEHFCHGAHELVFGAALKLADAGQPVEPATVLSELGAAGRLVSVGDRDLGNGGAFLHSLIQRAGDIGYHAPRIRAAWQQRNVAIVLKSCEGIAAAKSFDPDTHLDQIRQLVEDATAFSGTTALQRQSETVLRVLDGLEEDADPGLGTGYPDLDDVIGGMRPGEVIVVGGRPGGGKTLLGLGLADHVGTELGLPVLFASLEMSNDELTQRRIAALSRVPLVNIVRHKLTEGDWHRIVRAQDKLTGTQLVIDETSRQSLAHIRGQLRAMERGGNTARLLVIDYLGYMAAPTSESRQQAVAALARGVKDIARDHAIPVVLLAQLNREVEHRSDKRPSSSDLRESGEIEQSADIILLLYREDQHQEESRRAGEIDVIVSKNRQGGQCTVALSFQGHYGCIKNLEWRASNAGE